MAGKSAFYIAATTAFLAACATATDRGASDDAAAEAKPDPRIGPEADSICFARNIDGWRTIDGDDDAILLDEGVNDYYRVEFTGACRASDFRFANTIGIESRPAGGCVRKGDILLVEGAGDFVNRCFITRINEWDEDALEDEEAAEE